jgi:hypothetical protein
VLLQWLKRICEHLATFPDAGPREEGARCAHRRRLSCK